MTEHPRVDVVFPAEPRFLVMARVTLAALAAELDLDLEAIDDLRIAVDELCVALLGDGHLGGRVHLTTVLDGTGLAVEGRLEGATSRNDVGPPALDELSRSILEVIVDSYELEAGRFRFRKGGS